MVESIQKHLQHEKEEEESPKISRKMWIEGQESTQLLQKTRVTTPTETCKKSGAQLEVVLLLDLSWGLKRKELEKAHLRELHATSMKSKPVILYTQCFEEVKLHKAENNHESNYFRGRI